MTQAMRRTALAAAVAAGAWAMASNAEATVLDLTTAGSSGTINGADFSTTITQPTGSGVIHSFVRLGDAAKKTGAVIEGYNTDNRPLQFDENNSSTFTRSLVLADMQTVNRGGVDYYQFLLDINQEASAPLLSLDELEIYQSNSATLNGYNAGTKTFSSGGSNLVYDLDGAGDSTIELNYVLNSGSGSGDMFAYIKKSAFDQSKTYVTLYSKFGEPNPNNDGYEEWATVVGINTPSGVPLPASLWGGLTLLGLMGAAKIRSRRQSA
jgi:hypothetical protein